MDKEKELAMIELPDLTTEKPMKLEVGVTYKGSFKLSPNGQILVKPYQQGAKPANLRKLVEGDRHAIYASKHLVRIVISIQKGSSEQIRRAYKEIIMECYKNLNELAL